jgi:phage terminase large subunit
MQTTSPQWHADLAAYRELREDWRDSTILYVRQRFDIEPTPQQAQILDAIMPPGAKVSVRSGHNTGKSTSAAWLIYWFLETHEYAKIPCTAPSAHQLGDVLWGELSKWRRYADELSARRGDHPRLWLSRLFKLTTESLYDPGAREWAALARTARPENPDALQGFHAEHLLFVIDEASGVPETIFEVAEGAIAGQHNRLLMLGNPTKTSGTFYQSHHKDRGAYTTIHLRSAESTLPTADPDYRPRLVRKWGEDSNVVRVRADGEFPKQEDDMLISLELTEPCTTRERVAGVGPRKLGVDVARFGADRTALVLRQGHVVDHIAVYARQDTMVTVGRVVAVLDAWQVDEIYVDVIGLGAGVYDRLVELKSQGKITARVVAVNVSNDPPVQPRKGEPRPRLMRDYLWLEMARWLREDEPVFRADERESCEDLAGELASVRYRLDSDGCIVVEDKDGMKKRLGHSPDLADALGCSFAPEAGRRLRAW